MSEIEALQDAIAIVGLAGRFPGAETPEALWQNLLAGAEAASAVSEQELREAGVPEELARHPHAVRLAMKLEGVDLFDADFFGYSPGEARSIDPQQRLFLEEAWHALEDAGCDPRQFDGSIGVFAGSNLTTYQRPRPRSRAAEIAESLQAGIDSAPDFITTRVSYKLDLTGPSVAIQTACSTSLVAIHTACQSLLNFECDLALAGGSAVRLPQVGYIYQSGGITSPDGHCRAYDAEAAGTVPGRGVAIVALKRLAEAVADRDHIYALIRGTAINNDGAGKVGYTAPSVDGQVAVITRALAVAGIAPGTVGLVEGHGTGTKLGDAIELTALKEVFDGDGAEAGGCALGSIKSNIGHLDAAAGAAGLIKAALCLHHRTLAPTVNVSSPNSALDTSRLYVSTAARPWSAGAHPRRASVSSFGIGGTNAHAVLEEYAAPRRESAAPPQLIPLSARSREELARARTRLAAHLRQHPDLRLDDVAFTLQHGRRPFDHRQVFFATSIESLVEMLEAGDGAAQIGKGLSAPDRSAEGTSGFSAEEGDGISRATPLGELAQAWLRGGSVAWGDCSGPEARRVSLPGYPFNRRRHWFDIEPAAEPGPERVEASPPSELEVFLEEAWREVLGLDRIDGEVSFVDSGGDSLKAVTLADRIEEVLSIDLPLELLLAPEMTLTRMTSLMAAGLAQLLEEFERADAGDRLDSARAARGAEIKT